MLWQAEHRVPRRRRLVSFAVISSDPRFFDVRLSAFREQMEYLREAGYRSITPEQYERWLYGEDVSLPAKPIFISFDNGQNSLHLATPVLKQTGFATTVYVVSGRIGSRSATRTT
jgi:peptidoglycan/xylan/chitin deacetylase (PgdA/CDA1 family)